MGAETSIAWTDHTFNPWWGCTKVSPGCDNCYAEAFDKRVDGAHWGKGAARRVMSDGYWSGPLKWNRDAEKANVQAKVFCASMADVMDDEAPEGQRERLWSLIDGTPSLTWQLLTKRPQRFLKYLPKAFRHNNVWLGITAENQLNYDLRWPYLASAADAMDLISFVSYEPALGPLSIAGVTGGMVPDWLIFGGETGAGRRPMEQAWTESIREECADSGTKFFMKQMSAATPKKAAALIPAELLIRQFPEVRQ